MSEDSRAKVWHINCNQKQYKTRFPKDRASQRKKQYEAEITYVEDVITFWALNVEDLDLAQDIYMALNNESLDPFKGEIGNMALVAAPFQGKNYRFSFSKLSFTSVKFNLNLELLCWSTKFRCEKAKNIALSDLLTMETSPLLTNLLSVALRK